MAWTDFLGGALGAAPSLLERRRQFDADQQARQQQQQFQQVQLALMARDQELQEQGTRRDLAQEIMKAVGPGGVITDPNEAAAVGEFYKSKLQQQDATLPSTAVVPGAQPNALPMELPDGGLVVGGGGANATVSSPGQVAGTRIIPNLGEQADIDQTADAGRQRKLREQIMAELESGRAFAQPPQKLDQLRALGSSVGIQIPASFQEWQQKQDYEQKQRLEQIDRSTAGSLRVAQARTAGSSAAGSSGLTPEGLQMAAYQYLQTGQMPPLGMGATGTRTAILNLAGQIASANGVNPQANSALFSADKNTLVQIQKSASSLNAFENTAGKNIQVLKQQLARIAETGSPVLNQPLRALSRYSGDPNIAAFDAARTALVPEISRILANPNLVGVLSDSARQEGNHILDPNLTVEQFAAVLGILEQDMLNRKTSLAEELNIVTSRLQSRGAPGTGATGVPGVAPPLPVASPSGGASGTAPAGSPNSKFGNIKRVG